MNIEFTVSVVSVIFGFSGILLAIAIEHSRRREERERKFPFGWEHIASGVKAISKTKGSDPLIIA